MNTTIVSNNTTSDTPPGVIENQYGGFSIHIQLGQRAYTPSRTILGFDSSMPDDTPILSTMSIFEECVIFVFQNDEAVLINVSEPRAAGSVVFFYHANGSIAKIVPLEQLNPGWVSGNYIFRGDLRKFDDRIARVYSRSHPSRPSRQTRPTFWATADWQTAIVYVPMGLVRRIQGWQRSPLPDPQIAIPDEEQATRLNQDIPDDVQQILAARAQCEKKVTYQVGGLALLLNYVERIGLVESVNRYCHRVGEVSDGTVIAALVINRLLSPCPLSRIAEWVEKTGLHILLGIADPTMLNYDRVADALLAVYPHWQTITVEVTLHTVEEFQLQIDTIHYDLTSIFFHGEYEGSDWVKFGYSRDKRPDKRQVNIGISATADGEVVLPGGSDVHAGNTTDSTTTLSTHNRLHEIFQRNDLLVSGDSIMHDARNMLLIAQAHGRFLGPTKMTNRIRRVLAACSEDEFKTLPVSTEQTGREIKATYRRLYFKVKMKMTAKEKKRAVAWRKRHRIKGRCPIYREVHFWMHAAVILDAGRQKQAGENRLRRIEAYESKLKWTVEHLNKGRYYGDSEWVSGRLADLSHQFKDVRSLLKINFNKNGKDGGMMELTYERHPDQIAAAAKLDGLWVLVTNQRREDDQSVVDYLDWMRSVYRNHRQVERRMRNLKSDLPIRPIYLHRDEAIVSLCFVCVTALMVYSLVERDCQADSTLVEAGLRTTDELLHALGSFCISGHHMASGHVLFWSDTPTEKQELIWKQLQIFEQGTRVSDAGLATKEAGFVSNSVFFFKLAITQSACRAVFGLSNHKFTSPHLPPRVYYISQFWIIKVLAVAYSLY